MCPVVDLGLAVRYVLKVYLPCPVVGCGTDSIRRISLHDGREVPS